jgi:hypothetical protein
MTATGAPARVAALAVVSIALLAVDSQAQSQRRGTSSVAAETVAAFRASPLYRLSRLRLDERPPANTTFAEAVDWLNRQIAGRVSSNAPRILIESAPVDLRIPPHEQAVASAIAAQAARIRAGDEVWRGEIASNTTRRVTVEGSDLTALDVLKSCCAQADLQYADRGNEVVIGNVYFLRWPPVIGCRVFTISPKLVKELGEGVKNVVAPPVFHDFRKDWMTLVPESNSLVVFHHPQEIDAMAESVEYANRNADQLIRSRKRPVQEEKAP